MLMPAKRLSSVDYVIAPETARLTSRAASIRLPPGALSASITLAIAGAIGPNPLLTVSAALTLLASALLWRPRESPVLLFVFIYQWLQIAVGIFYADWLGLDIKHFSEIPGDMRTAAALSLIGLLFLTAGMRLGAGPIWHYHADLVRVTARRYTLKDWFLLYIIAWATAFLAQTFSWVVPGLSQPLLALADLKWAFYFILIYSAFITSGERGPFWLIAFALEFVSSIGGYFSDFKTVFFFTIFGMVAAQVRFKPRTYVGLAIAAALILSMGIIWTAIKGEYRSFVSGGQSTQVVSVGFNERVGKLIDLVSKVDGTTISQGVDQLIRRVGYLEFFGAVIDYVPRVVTYQGGSIWEDAIIRPFTPRLLFPGKSAVDDSMRTSEYTGLDFSRSDASTSISIGYMGETYIDFGPFGMMPVLAGFGYLLGRIYRHLLTSPGSRGILGMGLASAVIEFAAPFESSITKTFGALIVMLLVAWVLIRIAIPNWAPWVRA